MNNKNRDFDEIYADYQNCYDSLSLIRELVKHEICLDRLEADEDELNKVIRHLKDVSNSINRLSIKNSSDLNKNKGDTLYDNAEAWMELYEQNGIDKQTAIKNGYDLVLMLPLK
ncbi:MAG: hypothetical protein GY821_02990 [Gammaproteobacteria bacterium]|nr:hypothetical protein [Gammaproteobacteria bacterium]